jgi:hypothetical protein
MLNPSKIASSSTLPRRSSRIAALQEHKKDNLSKFKSSPPNSISVSKSPETSIPAPNHSANSGESKEEEVKLASKSDDCYVSHPNRNSNLLPSDNRNKKEKLQLPSPNDPEWKVIDKELWNALPRIFKKSKTKNMSCQELIAKFDDWLYNFFKDKFGIVPPSERKPIFTKPKHKGLLRLRADKKRLRKTLRILKQAGLEDTPEWNDLQRQRFILVRRHNRLRRALLKADEQRTSAKACKQFKNNPHKYTQNLFNPPTTQGDPNFSKEEAESYFAPLYRDEQRSCDYSPLEGMKRPPPPIELFNLVIPTLKDLHKSVKNKSNGAAAGINGLSYVIYKKCGSVVWYLHKIIVRIWDTKDIPADWAVAYIALLAKTLDLTKPGEFRPIAVGNTDGKIFFTIIADRLQRFMLNNNYIKLNKQKGFLAEIAGCIDHTFVLWETLRNATDEQRSFVTTWIDLANAYGSVRHNLIQFALNWYHVPQFIQDLIFAYYELLCAKITTKEWSSGFFLFDIGCFQGCVLSAILFDCVFNLLLDFLAPLEYLGYTFKVSKLITMDQSYADDLSITTRTASGNQMVLNRSNQWLEWTKTMKAKPPKCVSLGYRQFKPGSVSSEGFVPVRETVYAPYDPLLTIRNEPIKFILNRNIEDPFKKEHFKFLGRWMSFRLNEHNVQKFIKKKFLRLMSTVDNSSVNGLMKLWMYQFGILGRLSWSFLVHDFPLSLAIEFDKHSNRFLKRWAGIARSAELGILYRSNDRFGLGLTKISTHFKKMGVVKCLLLKHAKDPNIRQLYDDRVKREAHLDNWRATRLTTEVEQIVDFNTKFGGQSNRLGLGNNQYNYNPSPSEYRKTCTKAVSDLENNKQWSHSHNLDMQGLWTKWFNNTHCLDFSWNSLIYGPGKKIISFLLNASINTLPSPYLLHLMKLGKSPKCPLCKQQKNCNTSHILSGCHYSLPRYSWRHDSILLTILPELEQHLAKHNISKPVSSSTPLISSSFVMSVHPSTMPPKRVISNLLSCAHDWEILIDFDHKRLTVPPEICSTDQRPDIVIWSQSSKTVYFIELTCPSEENIEAAQVYKSARYIELCSLASNNGWSSKTFPVEAGARGFVARSMNSCFRNLGFTPKSASSLCKSISGIVARCSYHIWLNRLNKHWRKGPLLKPNAPPELIQATHTVPEGV